MDRKDDQSEADQPRRGLMNQRVYPSIIDQQLAKAEADGLMNNLPGQGRPQRLDDDANVPQDDRLGYRMLKGSGFSLPWVEARRDIDEERRRIDAWLVHANDRWPYLTPEAREKTTAEFHAKLRALHSLILTYNLRVPPSVGQLHAINIAEELRRLGAP